MPGQWNPATTGDRRRGSFAGGAIRPRATEARAMHGVWRPAEAGVSPHCTITERARPRAHGRRPQHVTRLPRPIGRRVRAGPQAGYRPCPRGHRAPGRTGGEPRPERSTGGSDDRPNRSTGTTSTAARHLDLARIVRTSGGVLAFAVWQLRALKKRTTPKDEKSRPDNGQSGGNSRARRSTTAFGTPICPASALNHSGQ